jgi:oligogalacturonide lyase
MAIGDRWQTEWSGYSDPTTGFTVRQMTSSDDAENIHFYFHDPCWTSDGRWLVFQSNRTGQTELFALDNGDGGITQISEGLGRPGGRPGMVSALRPECIYNTKNEIRAVNIETLDDRLISPLPEGLRIGQAPHENADGRYIVFGGKVDGIHRIYRLDVSTGDITVLLEVDGNPTHLHCSPADPDIMMLCDSTVPDSKPKQRVWFMTMDGSERWHPYTQTPQEWLTHESWMGDTGKALICYWPGGIMEVNQDGTGARMIAKINAWHAGASPDGAYIVVDTNWIERGLHLIERESGRMCKLCALGVDVPGDTLTTMQHPHPSFSPDGKTVLFGSERTGNPEIYCVDVAPALEDDKRWFLPEYEWHPW